MPQSVVYRSSSPVLVGTDDSMVYECPVGMLLREAPWVYDVLAAAAYSESAGFEVLRQSAFLQSGIRLVQSEKSRHREARQQQQQGKRDAQYARRRLKGR